MVAPCRASIENLWGLTCHLAPNCNYLCGTVIGRADMYAVTYVRNGRTSTELGFTSLETAREVAEAAVESGAADVARVEDGTGTVAVFKRPRWTPD